ncbi:MAG: Type II secretion system protein G precursor [Firmicutes bacterium ADurb.Bin419]|nr:MAG: Type II secretion system protein G precursor [Firmicutes bacterium ADurb.Bin419]
MSKKRNFGFTLIELLVVISIISILTIISVSTFNTSKIKARDTQKKADVDSIAKALGSYYADYGEYPEVGKIDWGGTFTDDEEGTETYYYMRVVPENEDHEYCYVVSADGQSYTLFARMEGEGIATGEYTACEGEAYEYAVPSINSTTVEFCTDPNNGCVATEEGESSEPTATLIPGVPTETPGVAPTATNTPVIPTATPGCLGVNDQCDGPEYPPCCSPMSCQQGICDY